MEKLRIWLQAARLRTLPLSLAGIITGTGLANLENAFDNVIFGLCLLITVSFQITSNFANDYGDGIKGTDADDRIGPARALQSGLLTPNELKWGIASTAFLSLLLTLLLLYYVFGLEQLHYFAAFLGLCLFSIWAAIKYTVGKKAYGYMGLGDLFVFLFFGLLSVLGTYFLYTLHLESMAILPATAIGLLSVGVLNLNNLRDVVSDRNHGKRTMIVLLGFIGGKKYHFLLILFSFLSFASYSLLVFRGWELLFLLPYALIALHTFKVARTKEPRKIDPYLKKLALATFALSVFFYIEVNYFL